MFEREYAQPRDPSLALCQICANRTDLNLPSRSMDGQLRQYRTCMRFVTGDCNDFVPGNIERSTFQDQAEMMRADAQYGRWQV